VIRDRPWFDPSTGDLLFDDYVAELPSYQRVMADEVVTAAEMAAQEARVRNLFRALERKLPPEVRDVATEALCELAVLVELEVKAMTAALGLLEEGGEC